MGSTPTLSARPRWIANRAEAIGEVTEWPKVHDWKSCVSERVPRVRIPPSPQVKIPPPSGSARRAAKPGRDSNQTYPPSPVAARRAATPEGSKPATQRTPTPRIEPQVQQPARGPLWCSHHKESLPFQKAPSPQDSEERSRHQAASTECRPPQDSEERSRHQAASTECRPPRIRPMITGKSVDRHAPGNTRQCRPQTAP